ncbi:MAG: DNA polymerase III subunit delta [Bacteroidia bacterium]
MAKNDKPNNRQIYRQVISAIQQKKYSPIYIFHGTESYFIDQAIELIEKSILSEDEREFNQTVLYGADTSASVVADACRRLPMMSEYQVVILKEAQAMKDFKDLESYFNTPSPSTILAIGFKNGSPDGRMQATKILKSRHEMVECEQLPEGQIPLWITDFLKKAELGIEDRAAMLFAEFTGKDLSRIEMECEKLILNFTKGHIITAADLERFIGLNKEYSIFDLNEALSQRNVFKANSIAKHFAANEKAFPVQAVIALIYGHFSKALALQYLQSKGENRGGAKIGLYSEFMLKPVQRTASSYAPAKIIHIIHHLRKADLQSKGYYSNSIDSDGILKELVFKILH